MAMQEQQDLKTQAEFEEQQRALYLIKNADCETLRQMVGFLFDEQHLRALIQNKVELIINRINHKTNDKAEKELSDFVCFFQELKA